MTDAPAIRREPYPAVLTTVFDLVAMGLPVLPLRAGKLPFGNCRSCAHNTCGGRPNMKLAGPCRCPAPCHAWAAATTDLTTLLSHAWQQAWNHAEAVAYHPGGARLTVVDLDNPTAVAWARTVLPPTRTVATTRGQHWIYRGAMRSANHVRPGVDIKSLMAYARWLGPGTGTMVDLPGAVRALPSKEESTGPRRAGVDSSAPARARWDRTVATGCRHTETYIRTGLDRGLAKVAACRESGAGTAAFSVAAFLARQHTDCPGPCGLATIAEEITAEATAVGVPERYARHAIANGFHSAGQTT